MPNIRYFPVDELVDPELRAALQHAARRGTPRPESQAIRAHVPEVLRAFSRGWDRTFRHGVCDHEIKELCRLYVSKTADCRYCGAQRSGADVSEADVSELADFEDSDRFDAREKAALAYARAIAWNPREADDALWAELHRHFSDEELVELGWFVALTLGQQRWLKTLSIRHGEVLSLNRAGLAAAGVA
jgi:alkylhydroperoxidase family enzyme